MLLSKVTYSAFRLYMFYQYVCFLGIEPTTFTLLTQYSTTEPQEHLPLVHWYLTVFTQKLLVNVINYKENESSTFNSTWNSIVYKVTQKRYSGFSVVNPTQYIHYYETLDRQLFSTFLVWFVMRKWRKVSSTKYRLELLSTALYCILLCFLKSILNILFRCFFLKM